MHINWMLPYLMDRPRPKPTPRRQMDRLIDVKRSAEQVVERMLSVNLPDGCGGKRNATGWHYHHSKPRVTMSVSSPTGKCFPQKAMNIIRNRTDAFSHGAPRSSWWDGDRLWAHVCDILPFLFNGSSEARKKKKNMRNLQNTKLLLKSTTADTLTEHKLSGLLDCSALQWDVFG